jgi:glycine/D-amino acid oxidase-like deaminating enzyme
VRVLVLGGGVVGVITAHYLAKEGAEVKVVDGAEALGTDATGRQRRPDRPPALLCLGLAEGAGDAGARSLLGKQSAIQVRLRPDPQLVAWGLRFLRECTGERARRKTLVKLALRRYSQQQLERIAEEEQIDYSPRVAPTIAVKLPIYPAKGYSVNFRVRDRGAPTTGGVDEELLVASPPLGDKLRMTSTAEFSGHHRSTPDSAVSNIMRMARELFPEAADYSTGEGRACLRPMTPDGPPVLSKGRQSSLFFNPGQGHLADRPEVGAILLECKDLPPYSAAVQAATGLPLFDWIGFVNYVH